MSMMGEINFFLGLQVKQLPDGIFINQSKYVFDILKKFKMNKSTSIGTPMAHGAKIGLDPNGKVVDQKKYRGMIGSLMYLTASRPDIMFSTCLCARFPAKPKESHLLAVKRIFRYIKGTPYLGLWYPKSSDYKLIAYSDADFGGNQFDQKSTSGHLQFLGDRLISWASKKKHCVSISTAEVEYVAATSCCAQVLWMKTQLRDYGMLYKTVPIYCGSKSVIAISANPVQHTKTKDIDMWYYFIKHHVEEDAKVHALKRCQRANSCEDANVHTAKKMPMSTHLMIFGGVTEPDRSHFHIKSNTQNLVCVLNYIRKLQFAYHAFCANCPLRIMFNAQISLCVFSMSSHTNTDPMIQDENVILEDPSDQASHDTPMPSVPSVGANLSASRRTPNDVFPSLVYILPYKSNNYYVDFDRINIHPAWHTISKNELARPHRFDLQIDQYDSFLSYKRLRLILELPEPNSRPSRTSYDSFPSKDEVFEGIRNLGYVGTLNRVRDFNKSNLPQVWYALFSVLIRCLSSKHSGTDSASLLYLRLFHAVVYDLLVDFTLIFWTELSEVVHDKLTNKKRKFIPFIRFLKLIVRSVLRSNPAIPRRLSWPQIPDTKMLYIQKQKKSFTYSMTIPYALIAYYADMIDENVIEYCIEKEFLEDAQDEPSHDTQVAATQEIEVEITGSDKEVEVEAPVEQEVEVNIVDQELQAAVATQHIDDVLASILSEPVASIHDISDSSDVAINASAGDGDRDVDIDDDFVRDEDVHDDDSDSHGHQK
ncbi:hypothetical protein L6452_01757 [Arctium lappa]|uniref:Uncharacterized protein n=1 Tax=Arctium lappa TaxID=4217 RepID=A0ACB9FHR1_ARCLA|nr:hypothetical protein L6452_01757 [Arctium lappa]